MSLKIELLLAWSPVKQVSDSQIVWFHSSFVSVDHCGISASPQVGVSHFEEACISWEYRTGFYSTVWRNHQSISCLLINMTGRWRWLFTIQIVLVLNQVRRVDPRSVDHGECAFSFRSTVWLHCLFIMDTNISADSNFGVKLQWV